MSELDFYPTFLPSLTKTICSGTILCGLFVAPAPVLAEGLGFKISIIAGDSASNSSVTVTGSERHFITDKERGIFKIDGTNLIKAVGKAVTKKPNDAFVRSPTTMDGNTVNLYEKFGGEQVTLNIGVKSASIVEVTSTPTIVATKDFVNKSSSDATFSAGIAQQVTNTFENSWSSTNQVSGTQTISYTFLGIGGNTELNYTKGWGEGGSTSQQTTVGSNAGVSVPLKPNQAVTGKLTASKGTLLIRVVYQAYLDGLVWTNYDPTYNGHHFNGYPIAGIMSAAGLPNVIEYTEDIKVGYYTNSTVELVDNKTAMQVSTVNTAAAIHR